MENEIGLDQRSRHVRAASFIGLVVATLFSVFNMFTPGLLVLGLTELGAVLLLVLPAYFLSRQTRWIGWAESLLLVSAWVIFGALIVSGGIEGTGLFWVYTFPFLAFFLKGQRQGWWFSLVFLALISAYFFLLAPLWPLVHHFSAVVELHFLMSLLFYTLVAAAFNNVRTRFETQLQLRKEQAEAAYLAKSRFLAAASHDLRQPAHALGLFVARLSQLPGDNQTRTLVRGVEESVRALQDMLDSFFDYSRLDSANLQVHPQAFALERVFAQLRQGFEEVAAQKGLRLRIRPSAVCVRSDPILLHRVLLNLVGNALQQTHRGGVLVLCRQVPGQQQVRIEVRDSGVGIAQEHHGKIFEEFFQLGNHERDRSKGLGLGLSIVERSCRLLGHSLSLRSGLGCGSCFSVTLPMGQLAPAEPGTAGSEPHVQSDLAGLHILLIEDDALGSAALKLMLESWGCSVVLAAHAQAAYAYAAQSPALDFVLSDYRLPGLHTGLDAVLTLRQQLGREIAACLISGDTAEDVRQKVKEAGLSFLQKPVRPAKLRNVLRHAAQAQVPSASAPG
jgi:signal transduction histidine kinase/CheY-like chemotaxis protein